MTYPPWSSRNGPFVSSRVPPDGCLNKFRVTEVMRLTSEGMLSWHHRATRRVPVRSWEAGMAEDAARIAQLEAGWYRTFRPVGSLDNADR
jgi:hypothetical protein